MVRAASSPELEVSCASTGVCVITHIKRFAIGFSAGLLSLLLAYGLLFLWLSIEERRAGFSGELAIDPVSIVARPLGFLIVLAILAVGFYLPSIRPSR